MATKSMTSCCALLVIFLAGCSDDAAAVDAPIVDGGVDASLLDAPLADAEFACAPSGSCTKGPECGSGCCGQGERCVNNVCMCGTDDACGADDDCGRPGPITPNACGVVCCRTSQQCPG